MLAQLGDPNAVAPLFADTNSWSPLMMELDPLMQGQAPQVDPNMPNMQGNIARAIGGPVPQVPMTMASAGTQPSPGVAGPQNGLTAEQYKMLMGQMPDQRGNYQPMSAPGAAHSKGLQGNFAMQQNVPMQAQRKPSLADLIYGGGR